MAAGDSLERGRKGGPRPPGRTLPPAPRGPVGGVQFYSPFYRGGANQLVKPEGLSVLAPGTDSAPLKINWPANGRILGLYASVVRTDGGGGVTEFASNMQMAIRFNDRTEFVFGGSNFVSLATLCSLAAVGPWFSTNLPVRANDEWLVTFRNRSLSQALRPELLLAVRQSPDGKIPPSPMAPRGTKRREQPGSVAYAPYFSGGSNRVVIPDDLPTPFAPMPPGRRDQPLKLRWPKDGLVQGMYGNAYDPNLSLDTISASMCAQLALDRRGERNLITNGQGVDYASFGMLFPLSAPWFPLNYSVKSNEVWYAYLQNLSAATSLVTDLAFAVYEDGRE